MGRNGRSLKVYEPPIAAVRVTPEIEPAKAAPPRSIDKGIIGLSRLPPEARKAARPAVETPTRVAFSAWRMGSSRGWESRIPRTRRWTLTDWANFYCVLTLKITLKFSESDQRSSECHTPNPSSQVSHSFHQIASTI